MVTYHFNKYCCTNDIIHIQSIQDAADKVKNMYISTIKHNYKILDVLSEKHYTDDPFIVLNNFRDMCIYLNESFTIMDCKNNIEYVYNNISIKDSFVILYDYDITPKDMLAQLVYILENCKGYYDLISNKD